MTIRRDPEKMPGAFRISWRRAITIELILFFGLWLFFGMLINAKNIVDFGQSTVEAIVDQHRFSVDGMTAWPINGDTFGFNGSAYSNKQPGQAMLGAAVYAQLKVIGVSYASDRIFAGALVIFFTASLLTALAAVALYLLARDLDGKRTVVWPLSAALVWALGTSALSYSGIAHHDVIATDFLVIAVWLLERIRNHDLSARAQEYHAVLAGALLGLTLTTSMLHFFMVVVFGIYFLTMRKWRLFVPLILGGLAGLAPMLIYDTICFGNPFMLAAIAQYKYAGYDPEVFFSYDWKNFTEKLLVYYVQISWYVPVLLFTLPGLLFLRSKARREQVFILAAIAVLVFYITNVEGLGTCAYGPRYLLPIMPFCALGVVGFGRIPTKFLRLAVGLALVYIAANSFAINLAGAMEGAMFCNMAGYAFPDYVSRITHGDLPVYPLFWILIPFFLLLWIKAFYAPIMVPERANGAV
jgi:hypothetical protein